MLGFFVCLFVSFLFCFFWGGGEGGLFPFNPVLCSGRFRNHNYDLNTPLCQTHFAFPLVPGLSVYFFISIHVISLTTLYMWSIV